MVTKATKPTKPTNSMLTRANYTILQAMLTGKYLRASITNKRLDQMEKDVGYGNFAITMKKLEEMGVIVGYIPLISEKGKKLLEAMKLVYGMNTSTDEKDASVEELLEPM